MTHVTGLGDLPWWRRSPIFPYYCHIIIGRGLLSHNQHGFRANKSTISNLMTTYDYVTKQVDSNASVDVILLDLAKAFDSVNHTLLIKKLLELKMPNYLIKWINTFLSNRRQFVCVNRFKSKVLTVNSGVPQGTLLGPILFSLFINDIFSLPIHNELIAFADDTKLFGQVSVNCSLQKDLDLVRNWFMVNDLRLNSDKCKILHFGHENHNHSYNLNNEYLTTSKVEKDLGILIDTEFAFSEHINYVVKKAFLVSRFFIKSFSFQNIHQYSRLFTLYISPILDYGYPLWFPKFVYQVDYLESVLKKFTKVVCRKLCITATYPERLKLFKLDSLEIRLKLDVIFAFKLKHGWQSLSLIYFPNSPLFLPDRLI